MGRRKQAALLLLALSMGACSSDEEMLPAACEGGPEELHRALRAAPGRVTLGANTLLSSCLTRGSDAGDVQQLGSAWVPVAQDLATIASRNPDDPAAIRLGYLIGAARRGAGRTQGIHDELVRRLEQEVAVVDTGSAVFRRGERAGRTAG